MSEKDRILRNVKRDILLKLASSASSKPASTMSTRKELVRIIKMTMSIEEIKSKIRQNEPSAKPKVLPAVLTSLVLISSLTVGLSLTCSYTDPTTKISYLLSPQWSRTYEQAPFNQTVILQRTNDSGYLMASGVLSGQGPMIASIKKLDATGNVQWNLPIVENYSCSPNSIQPTSDHGYVIAGTIYDTANLTYPWLVKTDSNGRIQWNKTYHGSYNQRAAYAQQMSDNGYVMAGDGFGLGSFGNGYYGWFLKTNQNGTLLSRTDYIYYSGQPMEVYSGLRTSDGGCIITSREQNYMVVFLKLNSTGTPKYVYYYSFSSYTYPYTIAPTSDGGQIVGGGSSSDPAREDPFLLKLNSSENSQWNRTYVHASIGCVKSIAETSDGGYIVGGCMRHLTTDMVWLARLDNNGSIQWEETYGVAPRNYAHAVIQKSNDEYVFAGITGSYTDSRLWLVSVKRVASVTLSSRPAFVAITLLGSGLLAVGCIEILTKKKLMKNPTNVDSIESRGNP